MRVIWEEAKADERRASGMSAKGDQMREEDKRTTLVSSEREEEREGRVEPSESEDAHYFATKLREHGVNTHVRKSRGLDIDAACGQLRRQSALDATPVDADSKTGRESS